MANETPGLPPLPRLSLARIFNLRDAIVTRSMRFLDDELSGSRFQAWVDIIHRQIGEEKVLRDVIELSAEPFIGQRLQPAAVREFAWRLAGNIDQLKFGNPALPWTGQLHTEWMPVQVMAALKGATRKRRFGADYAFKVLAGSFCPGTIKTFWTQEVAGVVAGQIGFTPSFGAMPFRHVNQLVGLRFFGLFEPRLSQATPGFRTVAASSTLVTHNRGILRIRFRQRAKCPFGLNGSNFIECHQCTMGYSGKHGKTACRAACHSKEYEPRQCPGCGNAEAMFDTTVSKELCITCVIKGRLRPH